MPIASIVHHVRRFVGAKDGNVAMIFALSALPLFGLIGSAVDYSRFNAARTAMQSAIDSTALMVSKDLASGKITESQINSTAQTYFKGLFIYPEVGNITVSADYTKEDVKLGSTIKINATGQIQTAFMRVFGMTTLNFGAGSTTAWGQARVRVALVLDNTGSMGSSGKIGALIDAVKGNGGFIDQLSALAKQPGDVFVSVVPFERHVKPGKGANDSTYNYAADWIDWNDWLSPPTDPHSIAFGIYGAGGSNKPALPKSWHNMGAGSQCPFTTSTAGTGQVKTNFGCTTGPTNGSPLLPTSNYKIPASATSSDGSVIPGPICPGADSSLTAFYNGCWTSEPIMDAGVQRRGVFCKGDNSCACVEPSIPGDTTPCKCDGSGSTKTCTGRLWAHKWTQPAPNDQMNNTDQPRVSSTVGFSSVDPSNANYPDYQWNSDATKQYLVPNDYNKPSSNPIKTWTGCVVDRDQDYDITGKPHDDDGYTGGHPASQQGSASSRFQAVQDNSGSCAGGTNPNSAKVQPIIGLEDVGDAGQKQALKDYVGTMQAAGNTNQSLALDWGLQTLMTTDDGGPFPAPAENPAYTYSRIIILLTDGANTQNRWTTSQSSIDTREKKLCDAIKGKIDPKTNQPMYTIYAIQVATDGAATQSVLTYCASTPTTKLPGPFFYRLTSSSQIADTFKDIGNQLAPLRLAN